MKSVRLSLIALLFILIFSGMASAQLPDEDMGRYIQELRNYKHEFLTRELNLSREQQRNFFELYDAMEDQEIQLNAEIRDLEKNVMENTQASEVETDAAINAIFSQKQREADLEASYLPRFKEILTPAQLLRLKQAERRFNQRVMRRARPRHQPQQQ